ncbi:hypothetical protein J3B02_001661 [Coemansia erecta]|uniref:Uncharacterized protein n=1 Tax=Coemansia asiatica TaxID=1052880 RepID=A0A9W8CMF9_9FUNG|nr:hypothetical protein LPJ64_000913 [Coemansia asiatica]KAJ2856337.1 hypothetical protein J3B02_001661 [Coemansia erecta]KAJ2883827.1 hypothetical protein FB639_002090 [Coemansia asiatica]
MITKNLLCTLLLLGTAFMAAVASAQTLLQDGDGHHDRERCRENERRCVGPSNPALYYRCTGGKWVLFSCGSGFRCGDGHEIGPRPDPRQGPPQGPQCLAVKTIPPACINGQRRCVGSSEQGLYYLCTNNQWDLYSCGAGYRCLQTGSLQATCAPAAPECRDGSQRCLGPRNPAGFLTCVNGHWQSQACSFGDTCVNIPGGQINCKVGRRHAI